MSSKNTILFALAAVGLSMSAHAGLPRSAVSKLQIAVHGIYTSADPLCVSGFSATVPLTASATPVDFTTSPTLGSGSLPASIGCVVIVFDNSLSLNWSSGSYTSSTTGGGSDNVCNAGGSITKSICHDTDLSFPAQITADAAAIGLTLATGCGSSPTGHEVVPLYLSTAAGCNGSATDISACQAGGGANTYRPPTVTGDTGHGIKLTAPATGSSAYVFVSDPDQTTVGNDSGSCGSIGPPLFSFRAR